MPPLGAFVSRRIAALAETVHPRRALASLIDGCHHQRSRLASSKRARVTLNTVQKGEDDRARRCAECRLGVVSAPAACRFQEVKRRAGALLIEQDELPERVHFVRAGHVILSSVRPDGSEQACAIRGRGTLLGLELLARRPTQYQAWALTPVTACVIDGEALRRWLGTLDSPLGAMLEASLRETARRVSERRAVAGTAVQRLARFLLDRTSTAGTAAPLDVPLRLLAGTLRMRPETLSRAIRALRAAGAIAPGRRIAIGDRAQLAEAGELEPGDGALTSVN